MNNEQWATSSSLEPEATEGQRRRANPEEEAQRKQQKCDVRKQAASLPQGMQTRASRYWLSSRGFEKNLSLTRSKEGPSIFQWAMAETESPLREPPAEPSGGRRARDRSETALSPPQQPSPRSPRRDSAPHSNGSMPTANELSMNGVL